MMRGTIVSIVLAFVALVSLDVGAADVTLPRLSIHLPLQRQAYQTNERIDLSVIRSAAQALPASDLRLTLTGEDGSKLDFRFVAPAVAVSGKEARGTEHLHVNGWLLRPGNYLVEATANGVSAQTPIEVYSHVRKSSFRLGDWGSRADGKKGEQAVLGEDSLGFNIVYTAYGGLNPDDLIRAGVDYMQNCTMSGAHQMDIRMECDWSDPYVLAGGTARVVRRALQDRTNPNCVGVHFYDEPGLTWHQHPVTKDFTPHNIPAQDRAFRSAFDQDPIPYHQIKADDPEHRAYWQRWGRWKQSFMDAAWKHAAFGVSRAQPDFLSVTQSVYGWNAFTDGYYFNVVRSLPVMSGHGGYDDVSGGYFAPSYTFEFGRMRDLQKPNWYLPAWYAGMPSDRFRMEQYLSFMNNLQGMFKPPDHVVHRPSQARATTAGVVESNQLMARLGTIFTTMPVTRPEVAVLYALSQNLDAQTKDMKDNYEGGKHGRQKTLMAYLAGKMIHQPLFPIVEEDVIDGTLAAHHKAVLLPGVNYLDPKVVRALEQFSAAGGLVLVSDESQVRIKGATKLGVAVDISLMNQLGDLWQKQQLDEYHRIDTVGNFLQGARPLAAALQKVLTKAGIKPVLECDNSEIIVARQAFGDVEYLFAVNASYDDTLGGKNAIKPATATLTVPLDHRPIYDAVLGGKADAYHADARGHLVGKFRFGPGQMRAFARTARPIGGVQALTPTVLRDYTLTREPLRVEVGAVVADEKGKVLNGSIPLQVEVIDPLGTTRYHLYRATDRGVFRATLPLGVNDPAGKWKVVVRELLNNSEDATTFELKQPTSCGAIAGMTRRAVSFGNDRDNIYRMLRTNKDVTLVTGSSAFNRDAAERAAAVLKPYGVRARIVTSADANKPREVGLEEAYTWCGLEPGKVRPKLPVDLAELLKGGPDHFIKKFDKDQDGSLTRDEMPEKLAPFFDRYELKNDKQLDRSEVAGIDKPNGPAQVGFDVRGTVILLGTPKDNPLIDFLAKSRFLPYRVDDVDFPGVGRGMIAWQRDGVGYDQESVTLIAADAKGMAEAVGSLFEAAAGLDPLTPWQEPEANAITTATKTVDQPATLTAAWTTTLPDRAVAVRELPGVGSVVLTQDGSLTAITSEGKVSWQKSITGGEAWAFDATADGSLLVVGASHHLAGFNDKGEQLFDVPLTEEKQRAGVTFVAVARDGSRAFAGDGHGRLTLVEKNGRRVWNVRGFDPKVKGARPNPYLSGTFTSDGKAVLALTANEVHVLDAVDGSLKAKFGGVNGGSAPVSVGDNVLLSNGRSVSLYSPAENKITKKSDLPDVGAVAFAAAGQDLIIGGEIAGAVGKYKVFGADPKAQAVWETKDRRRIVKQLLTRNGTTAVVYWGGLVRIFDDAGAVKLINPTIHDVAALAWVGDTLVLATADSRLTALKSK